MRLWDSVKAAASGVEDDGSYDSPHSADNCAARRTAAFRVTAGDLGLPADWGDRPFGVIVEMRGPRGLSTLIAFANGDASLLHETGSGIIGRQNHVHVVKQAKRLVARAADVGPLLSPTDTVSEPGAGSARLHFLTNRGRLSAEMAMSTLREDDRWASFMEIADELVSELSQYLLADVEFVRSPRPIEFLKSLALVAVIGGLTYAAWLIPIAWIRWPLVGVGLFLTAAALFVFYATLAGPGDEADDGDAPVAA